MEREVSPGTARAVVMVAMLLTMLGTCGVGHGLSDLEPPAPLPSDTFGPGTPPEIEELWRKSVEVENATPERRGLAIANILASGMLLIGGVLLITRRKSAPWFITQAAVANLLFAVAETAAHVVQLDRGSGQLIAAFDQAAMRLQETQPAGGTLTGVQLVLAAKVGTVIVGVIRAAFYVAIAYRIRKPDAAALMAESSE